MQESLAHVIVATSDYSFVSWLAEGERLYFQCSRVC